MSYNTQEISAAAGQPVELYRFVLGQQVWTVTSGREAITYQVESYQPAVIRRSAVEQSPEFARNGIDLECARDFAVAQLFAAARPNGVVSLTVFRNHLGDAEYITWWKGRVASVVFAGSTAKIRCESIFTALKRPGLRAHYQTGCRHALFDPGCGVNNQAYKLAGMVASFSGLNVTSSAFLAQASGWLTGGYLLGAKDPFAHTNPALLHGNFTKKVNPATGNTRHQDWLLKCDQALTRSKEDFVQHYKQKYGLPLPIWVSVELWEFGMLSTFFQGMTVADKTAIATKYGIPDWQVMESWLRALNFVRNVAAHHSRLWNKNLVDQPKLPKLGDIPDFDQIIAVPGVASRLYVVLCMLVFFMRAICPNSSWPTRLREMLRLFPAVPKLSLADMGFPADWETHVFWAE